MLKLFFYFHGKLLKARPLGPHENFKKPSIWNNSIQFEVIDNQDFMMIWTSLLPDLRSHDAQNLLHLVGARYPFSPHYQDLLQICPEIVFKTDESEWIFFGGSFHPWHQGHQACLDLIDHTKTCFVVPDRNPFKEIRESDVVVTILELSSKIKFRKNQYFVPTFLLSKEKNPTINWVEKLKQNFPNQKISLLLGFDSFKNLKTWTRFQELLPHLFGIYVASRLEDDSNRIQEAEFLKKLAPHLNITFLGHHAYEGLSSTQLRKK